MEQLRVYEYLSRALCALRYAPEPARTQWVDVIGRIERNCLPDGSGFDAGSTVGGDALADPERTLVIDTSYHHMDAAGYYTHWSRHTITVRATFDGFDIDITPDGEPEEFIAYLSDVIGCALCEPMPEDLRFKHPV